MSVMWLIYLHAFSGFQNMNADNPCMVCPQNEDDAEVNKKRVGSDRYLSTADVLGNKSSGTDTESPRWKYSNVCCVIGFFNALCEPRNIAENDSSMFCLQNESRSKSLPNSVEVNLHQKEMTLFTARDLNAAATGAMAKVIYINPLQPSPFIKHFLLWFYAF